MIDIKTNNGFSLVELLITILILSIGLLGLAKMQGHALKGSMDAYYRSQAALLTQDMAERIWANRMGSSIRDMHSSTCVIPLYVKEEACPVNDGTGSYTHTISEGSKHTCNEKANSCSLDNMAEHDLFEWHQNIKNHLPNGIGNVQAEAVVQVISGGNIDQGNMSVKFTITVEWSNTVDESNSKITLSSYQ